MLKYLIINLIALAVAAAISFKPVPMYYITQSDIISNPREQYMFNMALCGGAQFEHFDTNVFINFPDKRWNPVIGDYVSLQVLDVHNHVVASNYIGDEYQFQFKFLYHKEYSDLRLNVTSGNSPALKYTITVTFTNSNTTNVRQPPKRYTVSEFEYAAWQNVKKSVDPGCNTQDMITVFKTTGTESVGTAAVVGFELDYCFERDQFPGYIYISVLATDETSGFATYACTYEQQCTSVDVARFFDVTGALANFVVVHLTDPASQAGPIKVLVRGDGRNLMQNLFTLGASKFVPSKS